jgi:peptide/nickel transport system ATP-binding protein/oligopeptide transport system ATP-binding protein
MENNPLLDIRGLTKIFYSSHFYRKFQLKAVDDVSLRIRTGETLGIVGESGCGKSTLGRLILRLIPASGGQVWLEDADILRCSKKELKKVRRGIQMIFQNPNASLNPRMTILDAVKAPLDAYSTGSESEKINQVCRIFNLVGLDEEYLYRFPHEFSGGQRQRIAIARALVLNPKLIICDEPVSALDVSVRAQVLNLMKNIQEKLGVSYLFISHDLSVVYHVSNYVAVMYLGKIVEAAKREDLYNNPLHPYTKALLSAVLRPDGKSNTRKRILLYGEVPNPANLPGLPPAAGSAASSHGCCFCLRCPYVQDKCTAEMPSLRDLGGGHHVACHYRTPSDADFTYIHPNEDFYI